MVSSGVLLQARRGARCPAGQPGCARRPSCAWCCPLAGCGPAGSSIYGGKDEFPPSRDSRCSSRRASPRLPTPPTRSVTCPASAAFSTSPPRPPPPRPPPRSPPTPPPPPPRSHTPAPPPPAAPGPGRPGHEPGPPATGPPPGARGRWGGSPPVTPMPRPGPLRRGTRRGAPASALLVDEALPAAPPPSSAARPPSRPHIPAAATCSSPGRRE